MNLNTSRTILHVALAAAFSSALPSHAAIAVDGQVADWSAVPVLASTDPTTTATTSLKVTIENGNLLALIQGPTLSSNYNLLLDTDGNVATGNQNYLWPAGSGADFLVSNGLLYRSTGTGWNWVQVAGDVQVATGTGAIEIRVALGSLGLTSTAKIGVGLQTLSSTWQTTSALPAAGAFAPYPSSGTGFAVGKGVIIPAYLPLGDTAGWNVLKEGAAAMAQGQNPAMRDYWVTVNSGTNGPFSNAADWQQAATAWDPIRANGGRIFGYVHACEQPTGPLLRPLATVEAEISAWVAGYPRLDGIWIDEFYPRFEIAGSDGVVGPTYPNGVGNAPTDRGFVNSSNQFNGQQVVPTGGYYDKLIKWIRATYPNLRVIGNAGGAFYSNQLAYSDLPDVLVSFEQNFDTAADAPVNDWVTLNRQVPGSKSGQLALIHRNNVSLTAAVDQALGRGYTHIYTTNRLLEDNIWGGLPGYFTSEIQYISNHP